MISSVDYFPTTVSPIRNIAHFFLVQFEISSAQRYYNQRLLCALTKCQLPVRTLCQIVKRFLFYTS